MRTTILGFIAFFSPAMAFAAFPPFAETALYINSILANKDVIDRIGIVNPIDSITRSGNVYLVTAAGCSLHVIVKAVPVSGHTPPEAVPPFALEVGILNCESK